MAETGGADAQVWVEINVYSGRANPRVRLSPEESQPILAELSEIVWTAGSPLPPRLGFNGYLVYEDDSDSAVRTWITKAHLGRMTVLPDGVVVDEIAVSDPTTDMFAMVSELVLTRHSQELDAHIIRQIRESQQ